MKYLSFTLLFAILTSSVFASSNKSEVVVRIQADNGNIDEATMYFDNGITPVYVFQEDAQKVYSGVAGVPTIFSLTSDLVDVSINGYGPIVSSQVVALGDHVDADGVYTINAPLIDNMDPTSIVRLEDGQEGTFTDMRTAKYYATLNAADSGTGRFYLHVSRPAQVTNTTAGCSNNEAAISVTQDNSVEWTSVTLLDAFNNTVATYNDVTGQFNFNGLGEGDYYLVYTYGDYTTTKNVHINGRYIASSIEASKVLVEVGEVIDFSAVTTHTSAYSWDFGDGTLINGVAHPSINYYEAGQYLVTLICSNDHGCSDNAQINITVVEPQVSGINDHKKDAASVFANDKNVMVSLNSELNSDAQLQVYNLIGQPVYSASISSQRETVSLDSQPNGYYLVSVKNAGALSTKRVFLSK